MSGLAETLGSLSAAFGDLGARWYVFGAQAAILHGVARATADIDVTVDIGELATGVLAASLRAHGFALRVSDDAFVAQTRVLPVAHASGVPVDVVLAGPGLEALFFERLVFRKVGGVNVPVASAEDIIVMKVLGRSTRRSRSPPHRQEGAHRDHRENVGRYPAARCVRRSRHGEQRRDLGRSRRWLSARRRCRGRRRGNQRRGRPRRQ
jgi:hypothetical protein